MSEPNLAEPPRPLRARIFALSWASYFSLYFTRKNYSVAKSSLGMGTDDLRAIDTAYLVAYCGGQFLNGFLADVIGPRRLLAIGMLVSAALSFVFAFGDAPALFVLAFGLNGLAQSAGWPANGKLMATWFSTKERGVIMGWWGTCYQFGGLAATWFATFLLVRYGWRAAFIGPALWVIAVAVAIWLFVIDRPSALGYANPDGVAPTADAAERKRRRREAWPLVLKQPIIWFLGATYFSLKLTRYSLLFWLPYYLHTSLGYGKGAAGYLSMSFEIGGVVGVIASGIAADKLFGRRRIAVAACMTALLAAALGLYGEVAGQGMLVNFLAMMLVGALLFGPDALISGAVAQDVGGPHAAALACGMVNGIGSIGAILQGSLIAYVTTRYGWDGLFIAFQILAIMATLTLLPFFRQRPAVG